MNELPTSESDTRLSEVLVEWKVEAPLPPRFREGVWRRIARAEKAAEAPWWAGAWHRLTTRLARPGVAFSYLALLLTLGGLGGYWTANVKNRQLETALSLRYVQALDPYVTEPSR
jgi:hypothetical protein